MVFNQYKRVMNTLAEISTSQLRIPKTTKTLNVVYVGENIDLVLKLKCLDGVYTQVTHYENSIVAFCDIKQQKIKPDLLLCDSNMIGINAIELYLFIKNMSHVDATYAIIAKHTFSGYFEDRLKNLQINNVIKYPIHLSELTASIKHIISSSENKHVRKIVKQQPDNVVKRTYSMLCSLFV